MSSDTSTRSVEKKKTITKTLMKRLIGVVADLTHEVDHVLQKKGKPHIGFSGGEDMVLFPTNVIGVLLAVLDLQMWIVIIYNSAQSMNLFNKYKVSGEFESFGDSFNSELDVIEYWNYFPDGHRDTAIVNFIEAIDMPQ
ncbi:unnamed protein product [Lactuca virosa]|uniref:Uncharacterized protein n=1 Tax=Lactuca virosa TaxID=75947 RepID=A0AAU9M2J8_9ASTR|nr:unnamed protein product [Lactuca virosa]